MVLSRLAAISLAASFVLAGCGGGDGDDGEALDPNAVLVCLDENIDAPPVRAKGREYENKPKFDPNGQWLQVKGMGTAESKTLDGPLWPGGSYLPLEAREPVFWIDFWPDADWAEEARRVLGPEKTSGALTLAEYRVDNAVVIHDPNPANPFVAQMLTAIEECGLGREE